MTGLLLFASFFLFLVVSIGLIMLVFDGYTPREQLPAKPPKIANWSRGDVVKLKRNNPYKGSLRAGEIYVVIDVILGFRGCHIKISAENNTVGWFEGQWFVDYRAPNDPAISRKTGPRKNTLKRAKRKQRQEQLQSMHQAASEYEEIISLQDTIHGS